MTTPRTPCSSSRRSAKPDPVQMTEPDAASDETAFVAPPPTDCPRPSHDRRDLCTDYRNDQNRRDFCQDDFSRSASTSSHSDMERLRQENKDPRIQP
jgi:hypothetical protein